MSCADPCALADTWPLDHARYVSVARADPAGRAFVDRDVGSGGAALNCVQVYFPWRGFQGASHGRIDWKK